MKKLLVFIFAASVLASCGPSAEEKAAAEKMRQDSIQAVMDKMTADSLAAVQAVVEQARIDSTKPKPKPKPVEPVKTETPKVGSKRPGSK